MPPDAMYCPIFMPMPQRQRLILSNIIMCAIECQGEQNRSKSGSLGSGPRLTSSNDCTAALRTTVLHCVICRLHMSRVIFDCLFWLSALRVPLTFPLSNRWLPLLCGVPVLLDALLALVGLLLVVVVPSSAVELCRCACELGLLFELVVVSLVAVVWRIGTASLPSVPSLSASPASSSSASPALPPTVSALTIYDSMSA